MTRTSQFLLALVLSSAPFVSHAHVHDVVVEPVLAVVGGSTVTLSVVENMAAQALRRVRADEYAVRRQALEDVFFQTLSTREAEVRGLSVNDLLDREIGDKITAPTEEEQKDFYKQNLSRMGGKTYEEVSPLINEHLTEERVAVRRAAFLRGLKAKYGVRLFFEPPRVAVDPSDDPSKGPAGAPVTLVIFSDFQCPFCGKAVDAVNDLEKAYGKNLRVVFRDFPLNMHKDAPRAAEAGACAQEQGKFWRFHDALFADQKDLSDQGLAARAAKAGLNVKAFSACLSSGKYAGEWKADAEDGRRYGVTGTPTFFVNGRMLFGNQSLQALSQAVDDELLLRGLPLPGAEKISGGKKK